MMLRGLAGWSCGASSAMAEMGSVTAASRVQVTGKPVKSSPAMMSACATTAATASPRNRFSYVAKTGWSMKSGMTPNAFRPGTSAAVRMQVRPWVAANPSRSPNENPARGCGERITLTTNAPTGATSSPKVSVPNTFAKPSNRRGDVPTAPDGSGLDQPAPTATTASMIRRYPVQRHSTPASASCTWAASGRGTSRSRAAAASIIPGVQIPHWAAWWS